jgi:hypothetical protein
MSLLLKKLKTAKKKADLFTPTFCGPVPVSQLIPYSIEFVQRGFTERAAFEQRVSLSGRGLTLLSKASVEIDNMKDNNT